MIAQLGFRMPQRARAALPEPARVARRRRPRSPTPTATGLPDARDRCPTEPEDRDGIEDHDGCPDLDDDRDEIPDERDACRSEAETWTGSRTANGCPDRDDDRDGVADADDRCRGQAGIVEEQGCPAKVTLTEEGSVDIVEQIHFANNQAEILPESFMTLEAVAAVLARQPAIEKMRVEGHTDDIGAAQKNLALSRARAAAVARWLIAHGVAATRLEAYGCGELHPAASAVTEEGRAKNRRVLFQVVEPAPASGPRGAQPLLGCRKVDKLD